jgi:hypothetical protein
MVFSLEALQARHGDCLIVHYGSNAEPKLLLIDGGPATVYGNTLKPRLEQLRQRLADDEGRLPIELAMVSHIDDDHIRGLLDLTSELLETDQTQAPFVTVGSFWHNSFDDITGDTGELPALLAPADADRLSTTTTIRPGPRGGAAVAASVNQGRQLRDDVEKLDWPRNRPFPGLVHAPDQGGQEVKLDDETSLLVVAPRKGQLEDLQEEWDEQLRRLQKKKADEASIAAYLDKSVFNLSSIVCLLTNGDKTMLLTGDARGDEIMAALDAANVTTDGNLHVNVLKLPHHGSDHNIDTDFFTRVTADHYIASGDGRHHNPETATLQMLCDSRSDNDFTIHLTYAKGVGDLEQRLKTFFDAQRAAGRTFAVDFPADDALSLRVDLAEPPPD